MAHTALLPAKPPERAHADTISNARRFGPVALLALGPFAWFYAENRSESLAPADLWLYALATAAMALLAARVLEACTGSKTGRVPAGVGVGVLFFFSYAGIEATLSRVGAGPDTTAAASWGLSLLGIFVAGRLGSKPGFQRFLLVFAAANLALALVMTGAAGLDSGSDELSLKAPSDQLFANDVWSGAAQRRPDVYWIVVDSYPNREQLLEVYGFDNSAFLDGLLERGFAIAEESFANYSETLLSVPSTLEMEYIFDEEDPVYEEKRGGNWVRRRGRTRSSVNEAVAGVNRSVSFFRQLGYQYLHFDGGGFQITRCQGFEDLCLEAEVPGLSELERQLVAMTPASRWAHTSSAVQQWRKPVSPSASGTGIPELRAQLASTPLPEPFFLYAHIASPHRPYWNDADCNLLPPAAPRRGNRHFVAQLRCVNRHLDDLLDSIEARDPEAIVLLAADHGPRLSVRKGTSLYEHSRRQIRESLGILLALRAPAACLESFPADLSPVNSLRLVFACIGGEAPRLLPNRHYLARPDSPERGLIRRVRVD